MADIQIEYKVVSRGGKRMEDDNSFSPQKFRRVQNSAEHCNSDILLKLKVCRTSASM